MNSELIRVRTKHSRDGKTIRIILVIRTDEKETEYTINEGTYREIGCPLSGDTINPEDLALISRRDEERRARRAALGILGYGDNSESRLKLKLSRHGVRPAVSEEIAREMVSLGYINEDRQITSLVMKYQASLVGRKKIVARLIGKGYRKSDVDRVIESLVSSEEIDFKKNAKKLIEQKLNAPYTKEDVKKLLYKNGY